MFSEGDGRHSGSDTETFKRLVEDEDWVEGCEFGACDTEIEADDNGMEDDSEFEE